MRTLRASFVDVGIDRGDTDIPDVRDAASSWSSEDRGVRMFPPLDAAARHRPAPLVQPAGSQASQKQPV